MLHRFFLEHNIKEDNNMAKKYVKNINIPVDEETFKKVSKVADKQMRTTAGYVRVLIADDLAKQDGEHRSFRDNIVEKEV